MHELVKRGRQPGVSVAAMALIAMRVPLRIEAARREAARVAAILVPNDRLAKLHVILQ